MTIYNNEYFKTLAKAVRSQIEGGFQAKELFALAPKNDPFNAGSPAQWRDARWFKRVFDLVNFGDEILHLRRVHYRILSLPEQDKELPLVMTGTDENGIKQTFAHYQNHQRCWDYLTEASKAARYLGLIPTNSFVDNRAKEATFAFYTNWNTSDEAKGWYPIAPSRWVRLNEGEETWQQTLPEVAELPNFPEVDSLPSLQADGYWVQQPIHVEIWVEKSEGEDVFLPLCEQYQANFVPGVGDMSITTVYRLLERIKSAERPAVILYVADFDPSGHQMPIGVARKIEFMIESEPEFQGLEVSLEPVMLTWEQVEAHDLPPVPIKDSDHRKGVWESRFGGGVELNAMFSTPALIDEARRIVRRHLEEYHDPDLNYKNRIARRDLQSHLDDVEAGVIDDYSDDITDFRTRWESVAERWVDIQDRYRQLVEEITEESEDINRDLEELRVDGQLLYGRIETAMLQARLDPDQVPDVPEAEIEGQPDELMFHSGRQYFEQMVAYSEYRDGRPDPMLKAISRILDKGEGDDNGTAA